MGLCFSKKKKAPNGEKKESNREQKQTSDVAACRGVDNKPAAVPETKDTEKKTVVAAAGKPKPASGLTSHEEEKKKTSEIPVKKIHQEAEKGAGQKVPMADGEEGSKAAPVMSSSCTKEEVDAILIQCGRLSRSSSGNVVSTESGGGSRRRYSGSKRSYDLDQEKRVQEEDWSNMTTRPSPRRRTPTRERDGGGRSGSRERGNGGSRRVSRSPGRRSDAPTASNVEKPKQPAKMVSLPAIEKASDVVPATAGAKPACGNAAAASKRSASPRSRSPANKSRCGINENLASGGPSVQQSLSRSSSRKEQSPYRRCPMAEIDENCHKGNQNGGNNPKIQKATVDAIPVVLPDPRLRDQMVTYRVKDQPITLEEFAVEAKGSSFAAAAATTTTILTENRNTRTAPGSRSSRRSSRDFDHVGGINSYASLLLEDIQQYHQQHSASATAPVTAFSLPTCLSKACSIVDAVADLNSSSSGNGSRDDGDCRLVPKSSFVLESEVVVKDDLMEPSLHKYVSVASDLEPQESAGSNSFVGQQPWEPNSADSTDRFSAKHQTKIGEESAMSRSRAKACQRTAGSCVGSVSRKSGGKALSLPAGS